MKLMTCRCNVCNVLSIDGYFHDCHLRDGWSYLPKLVVVLKLGSLVAAWYSASQQTCRKFSIDCFIWLTHWGRDSLHLTFSNAFSWMKSFVFWFKFTESLPSRPINKSPPLVQTMPWRLIGDKLLSEPMVLYNHSLSLCWHWSNNMTIWVPASEATLMNMAKYVI